MNTGVCSRVARVAACAIVVIRACDAGVAHGLAGRRWAGTAAIIHTTSSDRCSCTTSSGAGIIFRADIAVIAGSGVVGVLADSDRAAVIGAGVAVIADDGSIHAAGGGVAGVIGAAVIIIAAYG